MSDDIIKRLREALAAGPTPGPWYIQTNPQWKNASLRGASFDSYPNVIGYVSPNPRTGSPVANADYIAAASPDNIRALLDDLDFLRRTEEAQYESLMNTWKVLERFNAHPGRTDDPLHDCVEVALKARDDNIRALLDRLDKAERECERLREFERSAALTLPGVYYMDPPDGGDVSLLKQLQRMSKDAARYRLLRRKFAIISDGEGNAEFCPINLPRPTYIAPNAAIELNAALDRERLGLDGTRPPTPVVWSDTDWIKHLQEQPRPVRHNQTEQEE